ncbi:MAG TPA: N-acetylmuramic acid 6-phosphate etherase [Planctomycetaceae bacterium]|nr:N-acetylmuramic acid 6-phosphate etherase [Planctomycetaceae bacterium]
MKVTPPNSMYESISTAATETRNPASAAIDTLSPLGIVRLMNAEDQQMIDAVAGEELAIAAAIDAIAERFSAGGRLIYVGAGTSGRLGVLDASECPPTFSTPPEMVVGIIAGGRDALIRAIEGAEDDPAAGVAELKRVNASGKDAVVGIATSGRTPFVLGAIEYARSIGALTIGLSCNRGSALSKIAELMITPVVGPEVITGSTRLKAGTATKLVLNMLTTGAMVRIGKTYENLMIDLKASNEKLRDRSMRIVAELAALTPPQAAEKLLLCGGEVKTAIVAALKHVSPDEARQMLAECQGHLRRTLDSDNSRTP